MFWLRPLMAMAPLPCYIKKAPPPSFADQNLNWFSRIILSLQVWL
jgi:hypothetical protein